ncbi:MAG TPA: TIGR03118 family protein [Rhodopila sp.]
MATTSSYTGSPESAQANPQVPPSDIGPSLHHRMRMTFTETDLVGSDPTVGAEQTDPNLVNPWGLSESPTSPFWISDNGSGLASIYSTTPDGVTVNAIPPITIAVPPGQTPGTASPTGQVFNSFASDGAFTLQDGSPAQFLFATEDGTISGWNSQAGTQSIIAVDEANNPADGDEAMGAGAVYKGLAIGQSANGPLLFAANFRHGSVDVYDQNFNMVNSFTDPNLPQGFAPFNVQVLDGKLFVTFAEQNAAKHDDVAGAGNGFVDEFNLDGTLIQRVASNGPLDSPWGLAIAPQSFGKLAGDLLVGNFGDGMINAFNLDTGRFQGALKGADGKPIVIGDLWAISPGNGSAGGSANTIYFTAGVKDEAQGLFGSITPHIA